MHTLGRCRQRSLARIVSRSRQRVSSAGSSECDGVIDERRDLSIRNRVYTRRRGGPVARAMGVSLPRSRALLRFLPSFLPFPRLLWIFFWTSSNPRRVVFTSSSSCRRKLSSRPSFLFFVPPFRGSLLILPKFLAVHEVQGLFTSHGQSR